MPVKSPEFVDDSDDDSTNPADTHEKASEPVSRSHTDNDHDTVVADDLENVRSPSPTTSEVPKKRK